MAETKKKTKMASAPKASSEDKKSEPAYSLKIVDHVLDNIYGQIGITQVEKEIEILPIFKRLHNISQLGAVNWIFPCAVHTRYVHSLGVMQMAYNMATRINMNVSEQQIQSDPFFNDSDLQIIRLAGMLHDIGHYPFSHNIEAAYKEGCKELQNGRKLVVDLQKELVGCPRYLMANGKGTNFLSSLDSLESKEAARSDYLEEIAGSKGYHHEAIGACIIANNADIFRKVRDHFVLIKVNGAVCLNPECAPVDFRPGDKFDADKITRSLLEMIASIVTGNYDRIFRTAEYRFEKKYSAMIQLIHSELDADNLDYLLRDATFSGTSYGIMDVDVLLNCLTVRQIKIKNLVGAEGEVRTGYLVGVLPKGIGCVEQFFSNKYLAYSQMIFSKYVSALEAMFLNWAKRSLPHNKTYGLEEEGKPEKSNQEEESKDSDSELFLKLVKSKKTEASYLHFTDAFIMQEIYNDYTKLIESSKKQMARPSLVHQAILSRLINYSSFYLEGESEAICVGFGEDDIRKQMKKDKLYAEYAALLKEIGPKRTLAQLHDTACNTDEETNYAKRLLAFRFESYSMTKQMPFEKFCDLIAPPGCENIARRHYYRLATGIPIFPKNVAVDYIIQVEADNSVKKDGIPDLIVDAKASALHTTWEQKFVYLRKYHIEDASGST